MPELEGDESIDLEAKHQGRLQCCRSKGWQCADGYRLQWGSQRPLPLHRHNACRLEGSAVPRV